jgi:hypothetical protein
MYSDADLDAAVAGGVLTADAVTGFRAFINAQRSSSVVDEEHFRLLTGFNDIFVSIAIVLILIGLGWIGGQATVAVGASLVAVASWGLGEYFTRRRRMALPSILLLLGFTGAVFIGAQYLIVNVLVPGGFPTGSPVNVLLMAVTTGAAYLHWRRFMVPITVAVGSAAAVGTIVSVVVVVAPWAKEYSAGLFLLGGMAIFALAMRWDISDLERRTRRSDVAFWLHLAAAPMMVHPAFTLLGLSGIGAMFPSHAAVPPVSEGSRRTSRTNRQSAWIGHNGRRPLPAAIGTVQCAKAPRRASGSPPVRPTLSQHARRRTTFSARA